MRLSPTALVTASLSLLAPAWISATPAQAQEFFGLTSGADLVRIDATSPATPTTIGALGVTSVDRVGSLAYDPTNGLLYGVGILDLAAGHRDYRLIEIEPTTGAGVDIGLILSTTSTGHVESLTYVHTIDSLVISHSDGGVNDFVSNQYATIDHSTAQIVALSSSSLDSDNTGFDPATGTVYSLDPNGSDWSRLDLATGQSTNAGSAIDTVSGIVHSPADGNLYGFDFNDNRLLRFDLLSGGSSVAAAVSLGTVGGDQLFGMTAVTDRRIGTSFCTAAANSTGAPSRIFGYGSDVLADNDVRLTANGMPANAFGYFIVSLSPGFVANPAGSAGNLCLSGAIGRYVGASEVQNSAQLGAFSLDIDLNAIPQPTAFVMAAQSETWNFQAWHRDTVGGTATSNFTPGLELTVL